MKETHVCAAFMAMGYAASALSRSPKGWGQLETVAYLCEQAERLESLYEAMPDAMKDDISFVWHYEVSEPFGDWFALRTAEGGVPSRDEMDKAVLTILANCFYFGNDPEQDRANKQILISELSMLLKSI